MRATVRQAGRGTYAGQTDASTPAVPMVRCERRGQQSGESRGRRQDVATCGCVICGGVVGNGVSARLGKPSGKGGVESSKAAKRISKQQEDCRRRTLQDLEFARDAERRHNGLGAAPVKTEKPSSPAMPVPVKPRGKRSKKASAARVKAPAVPRVADRGEDRRKAPHKVATAYMRLTPEEFQRERRKWLAWEKRERERKLAKRKAQSARKSGEARRRTKTSGTRLQGDKPSPADSG